MIAKGSSKPSSTRRREKPVPKPGDHHALAIEIVTAESKHLCKEIQDLFSVFKLLNECVQNYGGADVHKAILKLIDGSSAQTLQEAESVGACKTLLQQYLVEFGEETNTNKQQGKLYFDYALLYIKHVRTRLSEIDIKSMSIKIKPTRKNKMAMCE